MRSTRPYKKRETNTNVHVTNLDIAIKKNAASAAADDSMRDLRMMYELILDSQDFGLSDQMDLDELFGAMKTIDDVKAILVGQDSYADPAKVTAMAFSYRRGQPPSGSVKEIILAAIKGKDPHDESLLESVSDGYLGSWRDQGLLMVNSDGFGVSELIQNIVRESNGRVCGILLGNEAQKLGNLFKVAFAWNHPSRRSTINNDPSDERHWNHTNVFWKANDYIFETGEMPINWATVANRNTLWCFTDGAYSNKKKEGASAFAMFGGLENYLGGSAKKSKALKTNNVAELTAILDALQYAVKYKAGNVVILSDSEYCIKSITKWYYDWVDQNRLKEMANVDLISKAVSIVENSKTTIKFKHVRGHQKEPEDPTSKEHFFWAGNNFVDTLINYGTNK